MPRCRYSRKKRTANPRCDHRRSLAFAPFTLRAKLLETLASLAWQVNQFCGFAALASARICPRSAGRADPQPTKLALRPDKLPGGDQEVPSCRSQENIGSLPVEPAIVRHIAGTLGVPSRRARRRLGDKPSGYRHDFTSPFENLF